MERANGKRALETLVRLTAAREHLAADITIKERTKGNGQNSI